MPADCFRGAQSRKEKVTHLGLLNDTQFFKQAQSTQNRRADFVNIH
jgi:hypothetical protein